MIMSGVQEAPTIFDGTPIRTNSSRFPSELMSIKVFRIMKMALIQGS
jgi:hypothetical protein